MISSSNGGWLAVFLVPSIILLACTGEAPGRRDASAGLVAPVVELGDLSCPSAERMHLELMGTYGSVDGEGYLGTVTDLAVVPSGEIHVLDGTNFRISVFDAESRFVRTYAREGEGPGELRRPRSIDALSDGRTAVGDIGPPRVSVFGEDGSLDSELRLELASADRSIANIVPRFRTLPSGDVLAQLTSYRASGNDSVPVKIVSVGPLGRITDTLVSAALPPEPTAEEVIFWQPHWIWAPDSDGSIITSPGSTFALDILGVDGTLRTRLIGNLSPVQVSASIRHNLREGYFRLMQSRGEPLTRIQQARERLTVPAQLPSVFHLIADSENDRVWLESIDPEWDGTWPIDRVYFVVSGKSRLQGCASVPKGFHLLRVQADVAYGRWVDELDIPRVRSFHLATAAD